MTTPEKKLPEGWSVKETDIGNGKMLRTFHFPGLSVVEIFKDGGVWMEGMYYNFRKFVDDVNAIGKLYFPETWGKND